MSITKPKFIKKETWNKIPKKQKKFINKYLKENSPVHGDKIALTLALEELWKQGELKELLKPIFG